MKAPGLSADIRSLRIALGMTQQEFATQLGLAESTVRNYERGYNPAPFQLHRIMRLAGKKGQRDIESRLRTYFDERMQQMEKDA